VITACERGVLGENPLRFTKAPEQAEVRRPTWTGDESRRFLAAAATHRLGVAFDLMLATGLRRGELLALRWSDIDFDGDRLRISRQLVVEGGRHGSRCWAINGRSVGSHSPPTWPRC
jgi:integrase